jgi:hypothetical protein
MGSLKRYCAPFSRGFVPAADANDATELQLSQPGDGSTGGPQILLTNRRT